MPRIVDPKKYKKTNVDKEIERLEKEVAKEKEEKENPPADPNAPKKKKEPRWALWYVLIAIAVFFLGLLVIALINLAVHGQFGL